MDDRNANAIDDQLAGQCAGCYGFGVVGEPCPSASCVARELHFVPAAEVYAAEVAIDPLIGRLIDRYLVVGLIGAGGFGRVYRALELPIGMRVALKVANLEGAGPAETTTLLERFEHEASALAALNHPNIVRLLRYGTLGTRPYLVMELVPGDRTLAQLLSEVVEGRRSLTRRDVANVLFPLIDALGAAHVHGFVHRDVKPENIMLQPMPSGPPLLRLLDFGLARPVAMQSRASRPMGTPLYMAPEQLSGGSIGPWTDLYAAGVIAYELLSGVAPFSGDSEDVFRQKLDPRFDPAAALVSAPEEITSFLQRALAVDPTSRFRAAEEMRLALAKALGAWAGGVEVAEVTREVSPNEHRGAPTREARPPVALPALAAGGPDAPLMDDPRLLANESDWFELDLDVEREVDDEVVPEWRPRHRWARWLVAGILAGVATAAAWATLGPGRLEATPPTIASALGPVALPSAEPALIAAAASAEQAARARDIALVGRAASCGAAGADLGDLVRRCDELAGCRAVSVGARLDNRAQIDLGQPLEQGESLLLVLRSPAGGGGCGARYYRGTALIDGAWDVLPPGTGAYVQPESVLVVKGAGHRRRIVLTDRATSPERLAGIHDALVQGVTTCLTAQRVGVGTQVLDLRSYEDVFFYSTEEGLSDERGLSPCQLELSRVLVVSSPAS